MLDGCVKIIKSRRKTLSLQITEDANLIVRAPNSMSRKIIYQMIIKHKGWIEKKQKEMIGRSQLKDEVTNKKMFLYLGNHYKLQIVKDQKIPMIFDKGFFLSESHLNDEREILLKWYKVKSYGIISERVDIYATKYGFKYRKIKITNAQKRWGSCSSNGNLNFSWRIIMAPMEVIDYVVIHELVHLVERNHSRSFWEKVKSLYPQYAKYNEWLKENGYLLNL
ncbi:MAG: M48 family metallopeptidase [Thermotogae bacterium]|nr:M48 family metallopeptidase [Thermotogota bacterium]MCL5032397.1 M48 family metallopeptidase [Thermotogota bacterium]